MIKKILGICGLVILLSVTVYGAEPSINENFEEYAIGSQPSGIWNVVEKKTNGGSIQVAGDNGNKNLQIACTQVLNNGTYLSVDNYVNTPYYSENGAFILSFRIKAPDDNYGAASVMLRDNLESRPDAFFTLFTLTGGNMVFFPDYNGSKYTAAFSAEHGWYSVTVKMDTAQRTGSAYLDNVKMGDIDFSSKWTTFNFSSFCVRFCANVSQKTAGVTFTACYDDIKLCEDYSCSDGISCGAPVFSKVYGGQDYPQDALESGLYKFDMNVTNSNLENINCKLVMALYSGVTLKKIAVFPVSIAGGAQADIAGIIDAETVNEGDSLKAYLLSGLDSIRPISKGAEIMHGKFNYPIAPEIIDQLKANRPLNEHPRVLADSSRFNLISSRKNSNTQFDTWYNSVIASADAVKNATPPDYAKPDGTRMSASGTISDRAFKLAFAYKATGDRSYADSLWLLLQKAASYPDWNTSNFLDTSALCAAFGIGYDWCYDYWTPEQKETIRNALVNNGLIPAQKAYHNQLGSYGWWIEGTNNWCIVCNGGVALGALAIADEDVDLCGDILEQSIKSITKALPHFSPDGAWMEGPSYWLYSMQYLTMYYDGFDTALGTDYGLTDAQGISQSGYYPIYITGVTGNSFNLNDAGEGSLGCPELLWLDNKFGNKDFGDYRFYQLTALKFMPSVKDLLWYNETSLSGSTTINLPQDRMFRDSEVATFRSGFFGADAFFASLHGGTDNLPHGQIDIGQFIYEALGQRWAIDLGNDNYNLYNYFDNSKYRWWYYRNRAEGHNTLVINPSSDVLCDQNLDAVSKITNYKSDSDYGFAIVDMQSAYKDSVSSANRGLYLDKVTGALVIQDEITFKQTSNLYWFMHTRANVQIKPGGKSAILTQNGKRVWIGIISPGNEQFTGPDANTFTDTNTDTDNAVPMPTSPDPNSLPENLAHAGTADSPKVQNPNTGIRKLIINNPQASGSYRLSVAIAPLQDGQNEPQQIPVLTPLSDWR